MRDSLRFENLCDNDNHERQPRSHARNPSVLLQASPHPPSPWTSQGHLIRDCPELKGKDSEKRSDTGRGSAPDFQTAKPKNSFRPKASGRAPINRNLNKFSALLDDVPEHIPSQDPNSQPEEEVLPGQCTPAAGGHKEAGDKVCAGELTSSESEEDADGIEIPSSLQPKAQQDPSAFEQELADLDMQEMAEMPVSPAKELSTGKGKSLAGNVEHGKFLNIRQGNYKRKKERSIDPTRVSVAFNKPPKSQKAV